MKERTSKIYLGDIITFIKRIESYIQDLNFENFKEKQLVIDAVIRNLELIVRLQKISPLRLKRNSLISLGLK